MTRRWIAILVLGIVHAAATFAAEVPSGERFRLQLHGYATQGFFYTSSNNWNTTNSSDGSFGWNETVLSLTAQREPQLRVGVQARFLLLGEYGHTVSVDWALADYRVNEYVGIRAGKMKTPSGLLNESQDVDPVQLWILLPQSVYPIASRTTLLSHYGGVVYGTVPLGKMLGKMEYRAFGGEQLVSRDDGVLQPERDNGLTFPSGLHGPIYGGTLHWKTPVEGLLVGVSLEHEHHTGNLTNGTVNGTFDSGQFLSSFYYVSYEHQRLMVAAEFNRFPPQPVTTLAGSPPSANPSDARNWYVMTSYNATRKLSAGANYSYTIDLRAPLDQNRYQKDWTFASRYDVTPWLYVKLEEHLVNGTQVGFSALDNAELRTKYDMTLVKVGTSF